MTEASRRLSMALKDQCSWSSLEAWLTHSGSRGGEKSTVASAGDWQRCQRLIRRDKKVLAGSAQMAQLKSTQPRMLLKIC